MKTLGIWVVRHRWTVIGAIGVLTFFAVFGLPRLRVESDVVKWLDPNDPVVQIFEKIGQDYGGTQLAMVAVESARLFSPEGLRLVRDLTETYRTLPGVSSVTSLTHILDIRKTEEGIEVTDLLDPHNLPTDPEEIARLKEEVLHRDLYRGKLVSEDGRITLIMARLREDTDKEALARVIRDTTLTLVQNASIPVKVYFGGIPLQMQEITQIVLTDLKRLIPVAALVVMGVLFLGFHTLRGVLLPLVVVLLATLWTLGTMGWLRIPLSIISNVTPVILIAVGTAYGIHFIARYREEMDKGLPPLQAIPEAIREVGTPILLAGLTTLAGFLSFLGSYLVPINHFGFFTALGVAIAMVLSLTLIPAVLSVLPPPGRRGRVLQTGFERVQRILAPVERWVLEHPTGVLVGAWMVLIFAGYGLTRITTSVNMTEYFPENSGIRKSSEVLRDHFGGDLPIQFLVQGDLQNPFVLKEMLRLEKFIRTVPGVHHPQSLADLIAEMNETMNDRRTVPETREGVANLLFMLEGQDVLDQLVRTEDDQEGVIQARFSEIATDQILHANEVIERFLKQGMASSLTPVPVTPQLPDTVRRFLCQRVAQEIVWDIRYFGGSPPFTVRELTDSLFSWQFQKVPLSGDAQERLKRTLLTYFTEESDFPIPRFQAEQLSQSLVQLSAQGESDSLRVRDILRRTIPSTLLKEDPDLLAYTMETVMEMLREAQKNARVESWLRRLSQRLPAEVAQKPGLRKDLKGDLWTLVQDRVGLPSDIVRSTGVSVDTTYSIRVFHAGLLPIYTKIHKNLLRSQVRSLLLAFVIVALLVAFQLRSPMAGVLATLPILLVVALNFGLMGVLGIPLDNATMLIASIAIGIGIDYTIHMISRFRFEMEDSSEPKDALARALQTTGRAILLNAFTVGLGFLVLIFAALVPLQRFGWMVALTMGTSALAALTFLPAVILTARRVFYSHVPSKSSKEVTSP